MRNFTGREVLIQRARKYENISSKKRDKKILEHTLRMAATITPRPNNYSNDSIFRTSVEKKLPWKNSNNFTGLTESRPWIDIGKAWYNKSHSSKQQQNKQKNTEKKIAWLIWINIFIWPGFRFDSDFCVTFFFLSFLKINKRE